VKSAAVQAIEALLEENRQYRQQQSHAEAVCEALLAHVNHGGSIPWPSIRKPFEVWRKAAGR
jgi:hypothetical protein